MSEPHQPPAPTSDSTPSKGITEDEAPHRIAKLKLEQQQLRFQLSFWGRLLEYLKAATGIAAIGGLLFAFVSSNRQLKQISVSRDEERFDRAVSRLGSDNPAERLSGVSGLHLFLEPAQTSRQRATLLFLVNAIAIEKDMTVRGAILDTFSSVAQFRVPKQVLNEILATARDRNRGILGVLQSRFRERLQEDDKVLFEKGNDEAWLGKLSEVDLAPLRATAATMAALIRNGAYVEDLRGIYCVSCDFSSDSRVVDLSGAKFDRSYVRQAKFTNVKLENASFDGAYLMHTDFSNANLSKAKLTCPPLLDPPVQTILMQKALWGAYGPIFECADLSDADFTGSVLFGFYWTDINGAGYFPRFYGANLRGTNLKSFQLFTAVPQRVAQTHGSELHDDVLGIQFQQSGGYDILVKGWKENDYVIRTYRIGESFKFTRPIPREMWPSIFAGLNSLASAKNLSDAQMPDGLRQFLDSNKAAFSHPVISTTCPAKPEH
ncbi:MAG: pentapeptide repeat-containing protein [Acidobacteria bacterium]|nr:pentapeptide repeat-containing protein [Acidobacteriota bacterium]